MKTLFLHTGFVLALTIGYSHTAFAGDVRLGLMAHDVDLPGIGGAKGKEAGSAVTAEYIFDADWVWGARPYVYVSGNLDGNTSHGGFGVNLRHNFENKIYLEWGGGLSYHTGEIRVPNPADVDPDDYATGAEAAAEIERRFELKHTNIEFGSDVLLRNQIVVGYQFTSELGVELAYEHLSNGRIIGGPENEGIDNVGARVTRKF